MWLLNTDIIYEYFPKCIPSSDVLELYNCKRVNYTCRSLGDLLFLLRTLREYTNKSVSKIYENIILHPKHTINGLMLPWRFWIDSFTCIIWGLIDNEVSSTQQTLSHIRNFASQLLIWHNFHGKWWHVIFS